jgi:hypothetical protein
MNLSEPRPLVLKPFRSFVTQRFWANKDEYEGYGQTQPHTMAEYYHKNKSQLMADYRLTRR